MKKTITPFLMLVFLLTFFNANALPVGIAPVKKEATETKDANEIKKTEAELKAEWDNLSRKEKRAKKRALKKELKKMKKQKRADDNTILLVILAILLPPAAVAVYEGITTRFWISLLLTLLFYLPGLIYTLLVVLE